MPKLVLYIYIYTLHNTPQDKTLKCSVFRIKGPVPANSYILVPKNSNQSLGLIGRYFYLLFRPTPGKYFVVHLDVAAEVSDLICMMICMRQLSLISFLCNSLKFQRLLFSNVLAFQSD